MSRGSETCEKDGHVWASTPWPLCLRCGYQEVVDYEQSVLERALKLAEGLPPEGNLAPYLEIVRAADFLNLDVVRRS